MNVKQVFLLVTTFFLMAFSIPKNLIKKVDKEIKNTFHIEVYSLENFSISNSDIDLPKSFKMENLFKVLNNTDIIGYTYVANAPSRDDMFDYMVVFDTNLSIIHTKVLLYREDYGSEIGSKRWLKQFIGKTTQDHLTYGDTIDAISGATISVKSMTNAVSNLLKAIKVLQTNNIL